MLDGTGDSIMPEEYVVLIERHPSKLTEQMNAYAKKGYILDRDGAIGGLPAGQYGSPTYPMIYVIMTKVTK